MPDRGARPNSVESAAWSGVEKLRLLGFVALGLVIGLLSAYGAAIATAAGHGTYVPAILLFPYSMALDLPVGSIAPFIPLALLQYPVYGARLAIRSGAQPRRRLWLRLLGVHGIAVVVAFLLALVDPRHGFFYG